MKSSMNDEMRLIGREVIVTVNGCSFAGTMLSSGNHGVVLDVKGTKRTFSGFATVRLATDFAVS